MFLVLGRLLALCAIFLQSAVFLQPLLPAKFQVALVCETIVSALEQAHHSSSHVKSDVSHHHAVESADTSQHNHNLDHECLYCKVHGHLVAFLDLGIKEVFDRIQIRLLAFQQAFRHVYFILQQLFLLPQGRAPPSFHYVTLFIQIKSMH